MFKKIRNYCLKYGKLIQSVTVMGICLVLLLYSAFAWITYSRSVRANANQIAVTDVNKIKIAKTSGGDDISEFIETEQQLVVSFDNDNQTLYPGESGSFKVYLTVATDNIFTMFSESVPGGIDTNKDSVSSYRADIDSGKIQNAQNYLKGHLLFFLTKEGNVYSDWIDSFEGKEIKLQKGVEKELTVYWIWNESYGNLCIDSPMIAPDDISKIRQHYFTSGQLDYTTEATDHLFDFRGFNDDVDYSWLMHFYDFADEDIGRAIANIHFQLKFCV